MLKKIKIAIFAALFGVGVAVLIYPFWPLLQYHLPKASAEGDERLGENSSASEIPEGRVLVIPKIGVRIPIIEGTDEEALSRGAWRMPTTSTPDKGSNTVIS